MSLDIEVIDKKDEWDKFFKHIKIIKAEKNKAVGVGIFDDEKILDRAYKQEFGDPARTYRPFNIPQRSFLRHVFDNELEKIYTFMKNLSEKLFNSEIKITELLDKTGEFVEDEINSFIEGSYYRTYKPNAKITILRKGHDQPLIGTGDMAGEINHKLMKK